jgi:hypothetical protein
MEMCGWCFFFCPRQQELPNAKLVSDGLPHVLGLVGGGCGFSLALGRGAARISVNTVQLLRLSGLLLLCLGCFSLDGTTCYSRAADDDPTHQVSRLVRAVRDGTGISRSAGQVSRQLI